MRRWQSSSVTHREATGVQNLDTIVEATLAMNADVADAVLDSIDVGILACDADGRLTVWNRMMVEFCGQRADPLVPPERRAAHYRILHSDGVTMLLPCELPLARTLREGMISGLEIVVAAPGKPQRRLWCTGRAVHDVHGVLSGAVVAMRDLTEQHCTEQLLRESASRDPLTGLPNRSAVISELADALCAVAGRPGSAALLFIDLDGFKSVNDRYGHAAGDGLLQQVALRLSAVADGSGWVGRLGGDEFVIICPSVAPTRRGQATDMAAGVLDELNRPFLLDGVPIRVSASVGIAFSEPGLKPLDLVARSDAAMYTAKRNGKNRWCTYTAQTAEAVRSASRIERLVRASLDDGTFAVHYQPVHELVHGRIIGAEALARVPDGEGGWVSPVDFIPVAEDAGLIARLGEAVLEAATRQTVAWKALLGDADFGIGVNLSVRQLGDPELLRKVSALLAETGLPADAVVMELTESIFSDDGQHEADLAALRELGIKIFIDDFGTGYSSLSYLRRFAVDGLKIDKMFIADLVDDERDRRVTRAIVRMAFDLGIAVVAEGIETSEQLEVVVDALGCTLGQGFLFSKPMPPEALTRQIEAQLRAMNLSAGAVARAARPPGPRRPPERPESPPRPGSARPERCA